MQTETSLRTPRKRYPAEILTPGDVERLMAACGTGTWTTDRNRALIAVLYRSGLRISEAVALEEMGREELIAYIRRHRL